MSFDLLVPAPRSATTATGSFLLRPGTGLDGEPHLTRIVRRLLGMDLPDSATGEVSVRVAPGEPESYRLAVSEQGIEIEAGDEAGVRHAVQTLRQLIGPQAYRVAGKKEVGVPCGEVIDRPAVEWRGGMLDVARHFLTKRTVLKYVDLLAMHRMNRLHLHLTDDQGWRIESRSFPEISRLATHRPETIVGHLYDGRGYDGIPHGGYYTLDDLAEISAYARERGIIVVPEIDLPGHTSALLAAFPELGTGEIGVQRAWGVKSATIKPVPRSVKRVCELLDELLEVIDTPYVHLGGDECVTRDWVGDPEIAAHRESLGLATEGELHGWFLREVAAHLATRGKRAVMWDEAYQTGGTLPDTIVMGWRGDAIAQRAAADGFDVVRAPIYPTYLDYDQSELGSEPVTIGGPITLADAASFDVTPDAWPAGERAGVLGGQWQAWGEYIPHERHLDYMTFPRACAIAEALWSGRPADYDDLVRRLSGGHLARLEAAGCEYRPLAGPHPWQESGTGGRARSASGMRWSLEQRREWSSSIPESAVADEPEAF
ncbi:beta-N-acetylhexosaminidase [Planotetraspora sp. GP83]|uniref:beta-N-acetylhexosaminidase n=1 Tax=Planotetraspora sp. GP83 TaxID=3156264 RepID=UPI00351804F8